MGNPSGEPSGSISDVSIAGFEMEGDWFDVEGERGDFTGAEPPSEAELADIDQLTVHVTDSDGTDWYFTLYGPWESYEDLYGQVDDLYGEYGGEAG